MHTSRSREHQERLKGKGYGNGITVDDKFTTLEDMRGEDEDGDDQVRFDSVPRPDEDNPMTADFSLLEGGGTGLTVTSIRWENTIPPSEGGLRILEEICTALAGRGSVEIVRLECCCGDLPDGVQRKFVRAIVTSPTLEHVVFQGCILPIVGFTGRVEYGRSRLPNLSKLADMTVGGLTSLKLVTQQDATLLFDGIAEAKQLTELELEGLVWSMAGMTALTVLVPKLPALTLFSLVLKDPAVPGLGTLISVVVEHPSLTRITVPLAYNTAEQFEVYRSLMKRPGLLELGLDLWRIDIPFDVLIQEIDARATDGLGPVSLRLRMNGLLMSQHTTHANGLSSLCGLHLENVYDPLAASDYGRAMIDSILTHPEIHSLTSFTLTEYTSGTSDILGTLTDFVMGNPRLRNLVVCFGCETVPDEAVAFLRRVSELSDLRAIDVCMRNNRNVTMDFSAVADECGRMLARNTVLESLSFTTDLVVTERRRVVDLIGPRQRRSWFTAEFKRPSWANVCPVLVWMRRLVDGGQAIFDAAIVRDIITYATKAQVSSGPSKPSESRRLS